VPIRCVKYVSPLFRSEDPHTREYFRWLATILTASSMRPISIKRSITAFDRIETWRGVLDSSFELIDKLDKVLTKYPPSSADPNGAKPSAVHERVDRRPTDAKLFSSLHRREKHGCHPNEFLLITDPLSPVSIHPPSQQKKSYFRTTVSTAG
jgi:hypothetical protein